MPDPQHMKGGRSQTFHPDRSNHTRTYMADLRVNDIEPDLLLALKLIAVERKTTLRNLIFELLTADVQRINKEKSR